LDRSIVDSIMIWLGIITASIVIGIWVTLGSIQRDFARYQQSEVDAISVVKEYRKWNAYDETTVFPQDVVSLIFMTRGYPEVWVDTDATAANSFTQKWTVATSPTPYTAAAISTLLPSTGVYTSHLVYDVNGEVSRVEFWR